MKLLRTLSLAKPTMNRRQLLRALGVGAATVPLIPNLEGWAAPGVTPTPKRMLMLFTSSGIVPELWYPTGTETNWNLPAGASTTPLLRHKESLMFLKNLQRGAAGGGGHEASMGGLWTGNSCKSSVAQAATVDQIIAKNIPKQTDFQTYAFGVMCPYHAEGDITSRLSKNNPYMIHAGPGQKILSETDPYKNFDKLFAGLGTGGVADTTAMDKMRAEKRSIIDVLKEDLTDVNVKVGREDRGKIDSHLEAVRDIERRLSSAGPRMMGAIPARPMGGIALDRNANYPMLINVMTKIVVAALASDRTRIASLQYSRGFSQIRHTWVGARDAHHTISHKEGEKAMLAKIQGWYCERFAELFDEMKLVKEGTGTLLDSTLCVYSNELALGWTHGCNPGSVFWATGAQGKFNGNVRPGRYLDFAGTGFDYNQMLQTMAHLMGATSVNKIGDFGKPGTIPTLMS